MTGRMSERVAAGMDPEMGRAVLRLLRSARQPAMAEAGRLLPSAAQRPGLALIAVDDVDRASGTLVQHEWAARQSGAKMAHLEGAGHYEGSFDTRCSVRPPRSGSAGWCGC